MTMKTLRNIWSWCGGDIILIAVAVLFLAYAGSARSETISVMMPDTLIQDALQNQLLDCVTNERAQGSTVGTAEYSGEKWTYSWYTTQDWDSTKGEWFQIKPIPHEIKVPGESLEITFEDGTTLTYGEPLTDVKRGIWADNLSSLAGWATTNLQSSYTAIKRSDGARYLLLVREDGSCAAGWNLGFEDL